MRVATWYHIYATGAWAPAVTEHIEALSAALLPPPMVGIVGSPEDRQICRNFLAPHGWQIAAEADEGFEQVTLNALRDWLLTEPEPCAVMYAHTKGASTDLGGANTRWRQEMTARLIGEWPVCLQLLERHDAVGCSWKNKHEFPQLLSTFEGAGIYAGNFWWARSDYLRRLPAPGSADRHDAEAWIGQGDPDVIDLLPGWMLLMAGDGSVVTAQVAEGV